MRKYDFVYDGNKRWGWMMDLAFAIRRVNYYGRVVEHQRYWHVREQARYQMHPVIQKAVMLAPPADWHRLVLEWPHISVSYDTGKIAYTRSEQHGIDDRQTVTSVGKYITRNFPTLKDHEVRDLCGMYGSAQFKVTHNMDEMIDYVQRGPRSCMVFDDEDGSMQDENHPYRVYDPQLGWGLAVRLVGNSVDGRALVNEIDKTFVRTYARNDGGYSGTDEALNSWLVDQGYVNRDGWTYGTRLKYIPKRRWGNTIPTAPYIDGRNREVNVDITGNYLVIREHGDWLCDQTNGEANEIAACTCPNCDERVDEDDLTSTYDGDGDSVCQSCIENNYYYVYGRRTYRYYVHGNDMIEINGRYYHDMFLEDNNIVELVNGDYEDADNAVCIDGDWYHVDDENIVYCADTEESALRDDAWQCHVSSEWYASDEPIRLCDINSQDEITVHEDDIDSYEADLDADLTDLTTDETLNIEGA